MFCNFPLKLRQHLHLVLVVLVVWAACTEGSPRLKTKDVNSKIAVGSDGVVCYYACVRYGRACRQWQVERNNKWQETCSSLPDSTWPQSQKGRDYYAHAVDHADCKDAPWARNRCDNPTSCDSGDANSGMEYRLENIAGYPDCSSVDKCPLVHPKSCKTNLINPQVSDTAETVGNVVKAAQTGLAMTAFIAERFPTIAAGASVLTAVLGYAGGGMSPDQAYSKVVTHLNQAVSDLAECMDSRLNDLKGDFAQAKFTEIQRLHGSLQIAYAHSNTTEIMEQYRNIITLCNGATSLQALTGTSEAAEQVLGPAFKIMTLCTSFYTTALVECQRLCDNGKKCLCPHTNEPILKDNMKLFTYSMMRLIYAWVTKVSAWYLKDCNVSSPANGKSGSKQLYQDFVRPAILLTSTAFGGELYNVAADLYKGNIYPKNDRGKRLPGRSEDGCIKMCGSQESCRALNYNLKTQDCYLFFREGGYDARGVIPKMDVNFYQIDARNIVMVRSTNSKVYTRPKHSWHTWNIEANCVQKCLVTSDCVAVIFLPDTAGDNCYGYAAGYLDHGVVSKIMGTHVALGKNTVGVKFEKLAWFGSAVGCAKKTGLTDDECVSMCLYTPSCISVDWNMLDNTCLLYQHSDTCQYPQASVLSSDDQYEHWEFFRDSDSVIRVPPFKEPVGYKPPSVLVQVNLRETNIRPGEAAGIVGIVLMVVMTITAVRWYKNKTDY